MYDVCFQNKYGGEYMSTKKKKKRKKKQHRFFWFVIKLQIVLMLVVLAGFGYYYFGGYADQIQQMRREAVQEVSASDDSKMCIRDRSRILPCKICKYIGWRTAAPDGSRIFRYQFRKTEGT